jgi:hypothetical protein
VIGAGLVGPGLGVGRVAGFLIGATYRRTDEGAPGHVGHGGAASMSQIIAIITSPH